MQGPTQEVTNSKNISFNIDEFDIESYDFKPVTKGLGFHGEKENHKVMKVSEVKRKINSTRLKTQSTSISGQLNSSPMTKTLSGGLMSGIDAIYNSEQETKTKSVAKKNHAKKIVFKAPGHAELISAYFIDALVVTTVTMTLFFAFYGIVFKEINFGATISFIKSSWGFFLVFFSLTYISYFTILGPIDSLGKKVFGISQRDEEKCQKRVTIRQSFISVFISLLSIPLLFVPVLFDFHNKIAGIKIVKK